MTLLSKVNFNKTSPSGFTLIEMAIVMIISGIIIAMTIKLLPTFITSGKIKENQARMTEYEHALLGYAMTNFRLPYADWDGNGFEDRYGDDGISLNYYFGDLPYRTLGLNSGDDAYGNPVKYIVPAFYADFNFAETTTEEAFCELLTTADDFLDDLLEEETGGNAYVQLPYTVLISNLPYTVQLPYTVLISNDGYDDDCFSSDLMKVAFQAFIIVSGGPEDRDGQFGYFDLCNGYGVSGTFSLTSSYMAENKNWTADYDDTVRSVSFNELAYLVCSP